MEVNVINMQGEEVETVDVPEEIFEAPIQVDLMHQAFIRQLANRRTGAHSTKNRSEVSGGGKKPWRQKGTGRARHGSIRSPLWVGGGKVFTPNPRSYHKKMPQKMRRAALRSAISVKLADEEMIFLDEMVLDEPKTRLMDQALKDLIGNHSGLVIYPEKDDNYRLLMRSIRNLPDAKLLLADYLNIRDLLGFERVIIIRPAIDKILGNLQVETNDDLDI
ncbi:MAG: 50S ribosomal protein L4 [Anaerolineales bacterium]